MILCYWFSVASLCFFSIGPSLFEVGNILSVVLLGSLREVVLFSSVSSLSSFVSIICFMFPELEVSELFLDPGLSSGCIFSLVCKFYSFVSFVHSLYFVSLIENRLLKSFWDFVPLFGRISTALGKNKVWGKIFEYHSPNFSCPVVQELHFWPL